MHLVKWIRKNMGKLMAVFVIVIMIAFIMPSVLDQLARPRATGQNAAMWTYSGDKQITFQDIQQAANELKILNALMADRLLLAQQDIRSILLGQLLFPESERAAMISDELKNIVMQNRMLISPLKIDEFFKQSRGRSELFYYLLKEQALESGIIVSPKTAGDVLKSVIPQLTNNQADAAALVNNIASANGMSEDQVLKVFANLMSIMTYSRIATETENVTEAQLKNMFARATTSMDVNFVQFPAQDFTDKVAEPTNAQLTGQFEQFKNVLPGTSSEENPVGFGYKLPPRVALDYMIIKLDDIKQNIPAPTSEEIEDYYRQNLERPPITTEVPKDPNDPNSEMVKKQKSFAEVADSIKRMLQSRKINAMAAKILTEAIEKTDGTIQALDFEKADIEDFKARAGDYTAVAQEISKTYDVNVYSGRTSLLTEQDIQTDQTLGGLMMAGQSRMPTRLVKLAFSVPALGDEAAKLGPFEPTTPRMFVSIGPLSDMGGGLTAIVRVVEVAKSQAPDSLEFSYEKNLPDLGDKTTDEESKFVLKKLIAEDYKKLLATEVAEKAANEFLQLAKTQNWDAALNKINAQYGKKDANDPNAKTFETQPMNNIKRISEMDLEMTRVRVQGMPASNEIINQSVLYSRLIDTFFDTYEKVQQNQQQLPLIIDFEPRLAYYVVQDINVTGPGTLNEYEQIRQRLALEQDFIETQSATIDFLMPDNITGRVNLQEAQRVESDANDVNKPEEK